ncbi:MAG TPA: hypothetical protein VHT03_10300 [Rhizomicrobium sp.]|nr:hypothetical protein [Rhizomicrobium sp.]
MVLSTARSGTSALLVALGSHPDVVMHGEIFHEKIEWHINAEFLASHNISGRETDPVGFVKEILAANFGRRIVGFKMWRPQSIEACDYVLENPEILKFILERKNRLAALSSSMLAKQTQIWNVRMSGPLTTSDASPKIGFRSHAFRRFLETHNQLFEYYRSHAKGTVVEISYADVAKLRIPEVLNALEIDGFPLQHKMQKLHPSDILSRFDPAVHDIIRAELARIGHPEWAVEDV